MQKDEVTVLLQTDLTPSIVPPADKYAALTV